MSKAARRSCTLKKNNKQTKTPKQFFFLKTTKDLLLLY